MSSSQPRSSDHVRRRRRRAALREAGYIVGILIAAGLTYFGFVLLPSKLQTQELRESHADLEEEVSALKERIDTLRADTAALRSDPWVVERAVRGRLGYLRQGEHVFRQ